MNSPQEFVAGGDFTARVIDEGLRAVPLGAYAYGEEIHYMFLDAAGPRTLSRTLAPGRQADAVSAYAPLYSWDEREMHDDWDVRFLDLPDPRPLRGIDGDMPAAVTAVGEGLTQSPQRRAPSGRHACARGSPICGARVRRLQRLTLDGLCACARTFSER